MRFLALLFCANSALACDLTSYQDDNWTFARVIHDSALSPKDKHEALEHACDELDIDNKSSLAADAQRSQGLIYKVVTLPSQIVLAIANVQSAFEVLGGTEAQDHFKAEIKKIGPIDDPIVRIQKVYELVSRYQGQYDEEGPVLSPGGQLIHQPHATIDRAAESNKGGVCVDFAMLLRWSLLQVARHPDDKVGLGALSEKSFSASHVEGVFPGAGFSDRHAWVRINLPHRNLKTNTLEFHHFDLDTTWYPKTFTPIMPRQQGLSKQELHQRMADCRILENCLLDERLKDDLKRLFDKPCSQSK